jgi:hypothetical protein
MEELIISRLGQIINNLEGTHRVTDEKGSKYIQISDNAAKYMAREIKFASDYIIKNGHKDRHKQPDKSGNKRSE